MYLPRLKATAVIYMDNRKNSKCWWGIRPMSLKVAPNQSQIQAKAEDGPFYLFHLSFMGLSQMIFSKKQERGVNGEEKGVLINMKMNYVCFNGV